MIRLTHAIEIAAPASLVWTVSTDIEHWPDWLPTVTAACNPSNGPFGPGCRYQLKQPMQPPAIWEVTACDPGAGFAWKRHSGRMLQLEARHEIAAYGTVSVNRLSLICAGPLSGVLYPVLWAAFALTLSLENKALKRRCETVPGTNETPHTAATSSTAP